MKERALNFMISKWWYLAFLGIPLSYYSPWYGQAGLVLIGLNIAAVEMKIYLYKKAGL